MVESHSWHGGEAQAVVRACRRHGSVYPTVRVDAPIHAPLDRSAGVRDGWAFKMSKCSCDGDGGEVCVTSMQAAAMTVGAWAVRREFRGRVVEV